MPQVSEISWFFLSFNFLLFFSSFCFLSFGFPLSFCFSSKNLSLHNLFLFF